MTTFGSAGAGMSSADPPAAETRHSPVENPTGTHEPGEQGSAPACDIEQQRWDVAIVGGALAGAATAILLLRQRPDLKILILEKSAAFSRRVGEATVEISGFFLGRVLGLTQHLNQQHLVKQGMRFWFYNERSRSLAECSEVGGRYLSRVPAYQVDRAVLDEEVLQSAVELGARLLRPASVRRVELAPGAFQTLRFQFQERALATQARWVIDASGVGALLARQEGWWQPNHAHPTSAVWARWTGVKDWDGVELAGKFPDWAAQSYGIRATATNHFCGPGWWAWCIPLKGGDVSIGVVFDQRLVDWPAEGTLAQRLKDFLTRHPAAREIMADAQCRPGDVHWRKHLPYYSTVFAGDGFALVGDAAAFLDPFYSPGMDWISFTSSAVSDLIERHFAGVPLGEALETHNATFSRSYHRWFQALYQDKYEYLGDYELLRVAFLLDLGLYYLGVVSQPFKRGAKALTEPIFSTRPSIPFFYLIRAYNRRLAAIARERRRRDCWGRRNDSHRFLFSGYTLAVTSSFPLVRAFLSWGWLELTEGWRTWFRGPSLNTSNSAQLTAPSTAARQATC